MNIPEGRDSPTSTSTPTVSVPVGVTHSPASQKAGTARKRVRSQSQATELGTTTSKIPRVDGTVVRRAAHHDHLHDVNPIEKWQIKPSNSYKDEAYAFLQAGEELQAMENHTKREFEHRCRLEECADKQRQREHTLEMQAQRLEHEKHVLQIEVRKLELEVELWRLKTVTQEPTERTAGWSG